MGVKGSIRFMSTQDRCLEGYFLMEYMGSICSKGVDDIHRCYLFKEGKLPTFKLCVSPLLLTLEVGTE